MSRKSRLEGASISEVWNSVYQFLGGQTLLGFAITCLLLLIVGIKMNPYVSNGIVLLVWVIAGGSVLFSNALVGQPWISRSLITAFVLSGAGLGLYHTLWTPITETPLGYMVVFSSASRPTRATVAGIEWRPQFSELKVTIFNSSAIDYQNLDLRITPDVPVAEAAQSTKIDNVAIWRDRVPSVTPAVLTGNSAQSLDLIPIASNGGYRVKAPILPSHSDIELVMALAGPRDKPPDPTKTYDFFDPDGILKTEFVEHGETIDIWFSGKDHTNAVYVASPKPTEVRITGKYVGQMEKEVSIKAQVTFFLGKGTVQFNQQK